MRVLPVVAVFGILIVSSGCHLWTCGCTCHLPNDELTSVPGAGCWISQDLAVSNAQAACAEAGGTLEAADCVCQSNELLECQLGGRANSSLPVPDPAFSGVTVE